MECFWATLSLTRGNMNSRHASVTTSSWSRVRSLSKVMSASSTNGSLFVDAL